MAKVSDGYTVGSVAHCIRDVITCKRMLQLRVKPLTHVELINALRFLFIIESFSFTSGERKTRMKYWFFPFSFPRLPHPPTAQKSQFIAKKRKRFYLGLLFNIRLMEWQTLINLWSFVGGRKRLSVDWRPEPSSWRTKRRLRKKFRKRRRKLLPEKLELIIALMWSGIFLCAFLIFLFFLCVCPSIETFPRNKVLRKKLLWIFLFLQSLSTTFNYRRSLRESCFYVGFLHPPAVIIILRT